MPETRGDTQSGSSKISPGVPKIGDSTCVLAEIELRALQFLIDLEDRGSEWPHSRRIANATGITISTCEQFLSRLEMKGLVCEHFNLTDMTSYSISQAGRECYFRQVGSEE